MNNILHDDAARGETTELNTAERFLSVCGCWAFLGLTLLRETTELPLASSC